MGLKSRASRQAKIQELISSNEISSQSELADLLAMQGYQVSQTTLSRDLLEMGAVRVRGPKQNLIYAPAGQADGSINPARWSQLAKLCQDVLLSAEYSANLVVLKTPPGAAQYFASAVDKAGWSEVLGTIAGDDTIMLITRSADGGGHVSAAFRQMANSGQVPDEIVEESK